MTTEPFTPHADSIQTAWVLMCQQSRISTQPPVEELEAEFDRFIARVRRDAAREALDGLAENMRRIVAGADAPLLRIQAAFAADIAAEYKTTAYPETEDQT